MKINDSKRKSIFDKFFSFIIIETIFIVLPLLTFWWSFYLLNLNVFIGLIIGVIVVVISNIFLFKKVVNNFYNINKVFLTLMHIFYSICIFGFFMGVPLFNVLPGVFAGIYIGIRSRINNDDMKTFKHNLMVSNKFSFIVLVLICFCSAYIALTDKYTSANLEGMFKLNFHITNSMLWLFIVFGGVLLILVQYFVSIIFAKKAYGK